MATTLSHFRAAAEAHLHIASAQIVGTPPSRTPGAIAYLSSVALECSLKALILKHMGAVDLGDLRNRQPRIHSRLFSSRTGHQLDQLAAQANLARYLGGDSPQMKAPHVWRRMCGQDRPYSVRYGFEEVNEDDALAEREEAKRLHSEVKLLLGRKHR